MQQYIVEKLREMDKATVQHLIYSAFNDLREKGYSLQKGNPSPSGIAIEHILSFDL